MKPDKKGIPRILDAFKYSWHGFKAVFKSEEAFRQELLLCIILFFVALILDIKLVEKLFLISSLFIILLMELVNTAIEYIVDRISLEYNDLSKIAKDTGSLLVLISFIYFAIVWAGILVF